MTTTGLLLAAGGGRRMGRPKALVEGWLVRSVEALAACDDVVVVLGAAADEARALLVAHDVTVVVNPEWESGMGSSLYAGLAHVVHGEASRCLLSLVDLPDVGADVVERLLAQPDEPGVLARAVYDGRPGHPVLLGATTGPASWRAPPATRVRGPTSRPTTWSASSARTWPRAPTWTPEPIQPEANRADVLCATWSSTPRRRWRPPSRAPVTSPTTRWPRSCTSPRGCSGRCSSRVSPAPARPRWRRRWPRWRTCR